MKKRNHSFKQNRASPSPSTQEKGKEKEKEKEKAEEEGEEEGEEEKEKSLPSTKHVQETSKPLTSLTSFTRTSGKGRKASPFKPRTSRLDLETLDRDQESLRGFFTLFWIGMGFHLLVTVVRNVQEERFFIGTRLLNVFSKDFFVILASDFVMVLSMFVALAVQKGIVNGYLTRRNTVIFQHVYQCAFLGSAICWALWRDWPWTGTAVFVLHTLAMLMKLHSYFVSNGDLALKLETINEMKKELVALQKSDNRTGEANRNVAPGASSSGKGRRRAGRNKARRGSTAGEEAIANGQTIEVSPPVSESKPNEAISVLMEDIKLLQDDLSVGSSTYPENVTLLNFIDYLAVPTLVYEVDYPRTDRVRKRYLIEKAMATAACFSLLYITVEHYIMPVLEETPRMTLAHSLVSLLFPFMICYLLIFYIIFEAICGFFAELTRFADRNFYDDWWNSVTFDEFARKWNKPVHIFLLRHVYYDSMEHYRISRESATYLTFLLSSAVHELVLAVIGRRIRMYLFLMQMFQIPLIWIGRIPTLRQCKWAGNAFFWFGMFSGPPLLAVLYCREAWMEGES